MDRITVIAHMFNEEDFLPYWLEHHKHLFDHGVIIDANSNDRSVEIVHDICPTWTILNAVLDSSQLEFRIPEMEKIISGWKICLNIPEFIVRNELHAYLQSLRPDAMGVRTQGYIINETPEERKSSLTDIPLLLQRTHGYKETKALMPIPNFQPRHGRSIPERQRFLHRYKTGGYGTGRHTTIHESSCPVDPNLPLAWFGWGIPDFKKRKNQSLQNRYVHPMEHDEYSSDGRRWPNLFGRHHGWNDDEIEMNWREELKITEDLTLDPDYNAQLQNVRHRQKIAQLSKPKPQRHATE